MISFVTPMPAAHPVPFESLAENQRGRVVDVEGPDGWKHRLEEIGVREGTIVQLIKRGNPCILGIGNHRLSFRPDPGVMLLVEPMSGFSTY